MSKKLYGKDLSKYQDVDLDDLLSKLTEEELETLHTDLIDPDDPCVPPSERCRYKTDKSPSGPFDRKKLLDYLEKKAKEEKDWEEAKPYKKETRGKVWKPQEQEKVQVNKDDKVETEWDEVLSGATEEELVDLAAILGFHGMLNQVQYHQAFVEGGEMKGCAGGFQGVAKYSEFKSYDDDPPNTTDVEEAFKLVKANDAKTKEINFNNIKNISIERLVEFGEALASNTALEKLHMANTRATDKVAMAIAESLKSNKTLKSLNLESNYISGQGIIEILEAINVNHVVTELKVVNQRPQVLGVNNEMRIAQLVRENKSLVKFGIFLEVRCARVHVSEYLQRNNDNLRRTRLGKELVLPPKDEKPYYLTRQEKSDTADAEEGKKEEKTEESSEDGSDDDEEE